MGYTDARSYLGPEVLAAQNLVSTASGAVAAGATTFTFPTAEATWICSIGGIVTATPAAPPAGVKFFVVIGTATSTATGTITQSSGAGNVCTFIPSIPLASGSSFQIGLLATGTASATGTLGAMSFIVGLSPQFT